MVIYCSVDDKQFFKKTGILKILDVFISRRNKSMLIVRHVRAQKLGFTVMKELGVDVEKFADGLEKVMNANRLDHAVISRAGKGTLAVYFTKEEKKPIRLPDDPENIEHLDKNTIMAYFTKDDKKAVVPK